MPLFEFTASISGCLQVNGSYHSLKPDYQTFDKLEDWYMPSRQLLFQV